MLAPASALALGLVLVLALGAPARTRAGTGTRDQATGHDHVWHAGKVSVAGQPDIPCGRCHVADGRGRLSGRPDHKACFGACHGGEPPRRVARRPYAVDPGKQRVCATCHAPATLDAAGAGQPGKLTVAYPPYVTDPDHGITLSHAAHAAATRDRGDCTACHPDVGKAAGPSRTPHTQTSGNHGRCEGCHAAPRPGSSMPTMADCLGCHVQAYGPQTRPFLVRGLFAVTRTFSHERHRGHGAGDCRACHDAVAGTASTELPAPTMATCQTCHDGDRTFSVVGTHCRRCHTQPVASPSVRPSLQARYDHKAHESRLAGAPCGRCHVLDARGKPQPPARDHAPCSDAGCHRDEFSSTEPTMCGACHVGAEPWRPLHLDRPHRLDTEFGARFSHRAHLLDRGMQRACSDCHRHAWGKREQRLPRDHDACTGPGCHVSSGGATPALGACEACHVPGLDSEHDTRRRSARFGVRETFRHAPHRSTPGSQAPLPCTSCHADMTRAERMDDIPTPKKATCTPCHDGTVAFKVTGHGCVRCHGTSQTR